MIPVRQTNQGGRGNCMAACFASILDTSIDDVPDYRAIAAAGGSWLNAINTWLSKHWDLLYIELEPEVTKVVQPHGWHLINYGTRDQGHSVVGSFGGPVWDPAGRFLDPSALERQPPYSYGVLVDLSEDLKTTWLPTWAQCLCPSCIRGES